MFRRLQYTDFAHKAGRFMGSLFLLTILSLIGFACIIRMKDDLFSQTFGICYFFSDLIADVAVDEAISDVEISQLSILYTHCRTFILNFVSSINAMLCISFSNLILPHNVTVFIFHQSDCYMFAAYGLTAPAR